VKIAIFADVHSNIYALEAVLKDVETRKVDSVIAAGDLVGYAPFPNEAIGLIKSRDIPCVQGNYDDSIGFSRLACGCDYKSEVAQRLGEQSIAWTKANTSELSKEFLRRLPKEIRLTAGGYQVLVVHGSPRELNEYLYADLDESYVLELLQESSTDILVCGHTHLPYHRQFKAKHIINVGSIGKPKHGNPNAVYAIINIGKQAAVEFIEVSYDYEKIAQAIEQSELPNEFAELLREGTG